MHLTFAEIREKLAALEQLDPRRKIFGSNRHQFRLNSPLAPERLEHIESVMGLRLPEQYRRFVTEFGDGGAGPGAGIFPLERVLQSGRDESDFSLLARPFPSPRTVEEMREIGYSSPGAIIVSEIGCGAANWLIVSGPQMGYVWVQNPDGEWSPELSVECQLPDSEEHGLDSVFAAALASPDSQRLEFVDWYIKWVEDSLKQVSASDHT